MLAELAEGMAPLGRQEGEGMEVGGVWRKSEFANFIADFAFTDTAAQTLKTWAFSNRAERERFMKDMEDDVQKLKGLFMDKIGPDWATATRPNSASKLGIKRGKVPWTEVHETMTKRGNESTVAWIEGTARRLTHSFYVWSQ